MAAHQQLLFDELVDRAAQAHVIDAEQAGELALWLAVPGPRKAGPNRRTFGNGLTYSPCFYIVQSAPLPDKFDGPGGSRMEPVVAGRDSFPDDQLSVSVEAHAMDEQYEPRIIQADILLDGDKVNLPVRIERWHGRYGYGQSAQFTVPLGTGKVDVVLYVQHLDRIFQVSVPFRRDPRNTETAKWIRTDGNVEMAGTVPARKAK